MPAGNAGSSGRDLALLAAALAAVMFVFPLMVSFPLMDPDEGLHASIAQEMVERGDGITPQFLGRPFLDKPIFYFWAQAASLWLLGPSETAVRLPGLMFGLLGAISTGLLGWRMFDRRTGLIAGILYATTILPTALAQAASHDVALIPWINLTLLMLWESEQAVTRRALVLCLLGAGMFLGLAILTKGLFGVVVVGLAYGSYLVWRLSQFSRRDGRRFGNRLFRRENGTVPLAPLITRQVGLATVLRSMAVLIVAALVASPWYALVEVRHPGYLRYFFLERHVLGFVTGSQPHGDGPWWYYLPVLLGGGLPWIGYLPIVVQDGLARRRTAVGAAVVLPHPERGGSTTSLNTSSTSNRGATTLLWSWLIGWTLLMMVAGSKLATYLWPVFPPIAVLAATAWARLIDGTLSAAARRSFTRTFVWSSWTGPILLPAALLALQAIFAMRFAWPVWVAAAAAAAVAPLPLVPWLAPVGDWSIFRREGVFHRQIPSEHMDQSPSAARAEASLATAALSLAVQFVVVMTMVVPPVAETCSARELAEHFNRLGRLPQRLLVVEGRLGALVFYLDPQLRLGLEAERLQALPAEELPPLRPGDVLAVPERKVRKLHGRLDLGNNQYESVGPYRLYIIKPRPPVAAS